MINRSPPSRALASCFNSNQISFLFALEHKSATPARGWRHLAAPRLAAHLTDSVGC